MPFIPSDKQRIVNALQLDRSQLRRDSYLQRLMDELAEFDVAEGTDQIELVRVLLDEFESASAELTTAASSAGITSYDISGGESIQYESGASVIIGELDPYLSKAAEIEAILDPNAYLERYKSYGRAIAT